LITGLRDVQGDAAERTTQLPCEIHIATTDDDGQRSNITNQIDHDRTRVAPGDRSPGAPTDPDVRISRIRLFESRTRYAPRGFGSGNCCRSARARCHVSRELFERRFSHLIHAFCT
jgi:hypothetical protein